jgi:thiamine biosynthesis lipoprotein
MFGCAVRVRGAEMRLVRVSDGGTPMGTYMMATVYAPDEEKGRQAIAAAFARVEEIEAATSHYRETSDISKLNAAAGGPPMPVSKDLWACLRRSAEVSAETDGAFDVTIGPLMALWKRTWRKGKAPSDAETAAAKALVDWRAVRPDPDKPLAQLLKKGMLLDLGAIGKGYAVDQAVAVLRQRRIPAALVDMGGNVAAYGAPPERQAWLIGIRDPSRPGKILPKPIRLLNQGVATSGDYEQFGVVAGRRYSHILDPRTGKPLEGMTSVTVVAPDATTADGYSTALSVLGPEKALTFAEKRPGVEVMIMFERDGKTHTARTKGFERLEVTPTDSP